MSLSGGDEKDTQEKLTSEIFQNYGHLTESIYACSDTQCAMYTATDKGKFCQKSLPMNLKFACLYIDPFYSI